MNEPVPHDRPKRTWFRSRRSWQLDQIQDLLVHIDAALVVRDPGTARSVDAYEGLRKQVIAAAGDRRRLLVMLSELAEALRLGQDPEQLQSKTDEWMLQADLMRLTNPAAEEAYEIVGHGSGNLKVTVPAYVDASSGFVIRRGIAERTEEDRGKAPAAAEPTDDVADQGSTESETSDRAAEEDA